MCTCAGCALLGLHARRKKNVVLLLLLLLLLNTRWRYGRVNYSLFFRMCHRCCHHLLVLVVLFFSCWSWGGRTDLLPVQTLSHLQLISVQPLNPLCGHQPASLPTSYQDIVGHTVVMLGSCQTSFLDLSHLCFSVAVHHPASTPSNIACTWLQLPDFPLGC